MTLPLESLKERLVILLLRRRSPQQSLTISLIVRESYSIPLTEIKVEADGKLGNAYVCVDHTNVGKGVTLIYIRSRMENRYGVGFNHKLRKSLSQNPSAPYDKFHTP